MTTTNRTAVMEGMTAVEHAQAAADAVRAINHLTYHETALPYPVDVWRLLNHLATAVDRLPQALRQTATLLAGQHQRGEIGIDAGTEYPDANSAVADTLSALQHAEAAAADLAAALDRAAGPLTYAHHLSPGDDARETADTTEGWS